MQPLRALGVLLAIGLTGVSLEASAQCASSASSCVTCHEAVGGRSVLGDGRPWHSDHGFGDLCAACHGGNPAAASKIEAHADRYPPLEDPARSCAGCHAEDAGARAERYRARAASAVAAGRSGPPQPPSPPASGVEPGVRGASAGNVASDRTLLAVGAAIALLLAHLVARDRRPLGRVRPIAWLRAKTWSAYAAGAGLGVVVAVSEARYGRPIAASGAFDKLAAYPGHALFPRSPYYAYVMHPGITWQVWLVLGVLVGSFASAKLAGVAHPRWLPDAAWVDRFGSRRSARLLVAFFGAVLVQVGAGIAGGCTSGLAISGGAVLSPAAFVFMAGMFASGIPTAWLWDRLARARAHAHDRKSPP